MASPIFLSCFLVFANESLVLPRNALYVTILSAILPMSQGMKQLLGNQDYRSPTGGKKVTIAAVE